MLAIKYNINYRQIILTSESNELVDVYQKSGRVRSVRFLGFIALGSAKWFRKNEATPVRIRVTHLSAEASKSLYNWSELRDGEFVQGCIIHDGVFAVTLNGKPRVVKKQF